MLISLIHPSRGRPELPLKEASDIINKSSGKHKLEYIICVDTSDPKLPEYKRLFGGTFSQIFSNVVLKVFDSKNCVQSLNNGAKISTGDILIYVSDDFIFPQNWDQLIVEKTKGITDWVLWVRDGIQDRISTGIIMDRIYYNRDKFLYHPDFFSMYADDFLTWLAKQ